MKNTKQLAENGRDSWEIEITGRPIERRNKSLLAVFLLVFIVIFAPAIHGSLDSFIDSLSFDFNLNSTFVVQNQVDYMLDLNNNNIPDMLYFNLTSNVSITGTYIIFVDLEDKEGIVSIIKNESVTSGINTVITNISTEF